MPRSIMRTLLSLCAIALLCLQTEARSPQGPDLIGATPSATARAPSDIADDGIDLRSGLDVRQGIVRARAFLGLHDYRSARSEVAIVLAAHPDDVSALRTRAAIEEATGRWRHAANDWARVAALTNDDAAAGRRDALVRAHPAFVAITGFFEGSAGVDEMHGVRLSAARRPLDGPELTASLEHRTARADAAQRLNGSIGPIDTDRRKLDVEIADTLVAGRIGVRLIATDDALGAGASFRRQRPWGYLEAVAGYHDPYWAYASAIQNGATADHVSFGGDFTRGRWAVRGRLALVSYAVDDRDAVARSTKGLLGLDYALGSPGVPTPWRLSLALDREAFFAVKERQGPGGVPFAPIAVADRLILSAGTTKTFGDPAHRYATIGLGYRRDSESDTQGPYGLILAETPIGREVRLGLRAEYSDVATRGVSTDPYSFAEIYLRRTF